MPRLTADLIESMSGVYLSPRYDSPQPTPDFHRECWNRYCSDVPAAATAAPRNHAKSTALTHDYILANVLWRAEPYVILVGASEDLAIEHLGDIASELRENEELIQAFKIKEFIQDQKTDIIVECQDGYQFRIIARGAEQKIRGKKWRGRRPGLIVCDDLEDDEQVENRDRRKKFRRWFFRACKQALRDGGKIRVHGTILHVDSLLNHLMKNRSWASKLYKAHKSFADFSQILWPEKFPKERLIQIRQEFIDEGDSAGYSQEYLNDPRDNDDSYYQENWFVPMTLEDRELFKRFGVGVDFAVSKRDTANRTAMVVAGKAMDNILYHVDFIAGRFDTNEVIDIFFELYDRWHIEWFWVEDGVIWKTMWPIIQEEMLERDIFLNFIPMRCSTDKAVRGRPAQKRMKAGGSRYDKDHPEFLDFKEELMLFTGNSEAPADDYHDSHAHLAAGMQDVNVDEDDAVSEEDQEMLRRDPRKQIGRSPTTGY
jgi:hypothetical protein